MRNAQIQGRSGVTLIEMTISMTVMTIILGAVIALHLQGLRMYQETASASQADFSAASAIELMEGQIEGCFRVTGRYADRITVSMPKVTYDSGTGEYLPDQPLAAGDSVRFYLSDQTGSIAQVGPYLWRAVKLEGATAYTLDRAPLAVGIQSLEFTYTMAPAPRADIVDSVGVRVRAQNRVGGTTQERSHVSDVVLRNAYYGPITHETGLDPVEE